MAQLGDGARFFEPGSMLYTVLSLGILLRHCGCLTFLLFATLLASPPSLFSSQNVAINSKRERKEGNDKQKRESHTEEIAVCKVFSNDLFPFNLERALLHSLGHPSFCRGGKAPSSVQYVR